MSIPMRVEEMMMRRGAVGSFPTWTIQRNSKVILYECVLDNAKKIKPGINTIFVCYKKTSPRDKVYIHQNVETFLASFFKINYKILCYHEPYKGTYDKKRLAKIITSDTGVRYFGLKLGDICKITRRNGEICFRVVIDTQS